MRLPERGQAGVWLNGLALSKGAVRNQFVDGKLTCGLNKLPPSVLFCERAALVDHLILELQRLQPDRCDRRLDCCIPCSSKPCCLASVLLASAAARGSSSQGTCAVAWLLTDLLMN